MFASAAILALAFVSATVAAPDPTTPGPSDSYVAGGDCTIAWTLDTNTTKPWTTMNIQLMSGPNEKMVEMRTVAVVDATKQASFNWTCPEVTPNSKIYFYQFSSPVDPTNLLWVTRFLIAGADGSSTPPTNTTAGIQWGVGEFVDPNEYNQPPLYLNGDGQTVGGNNNTAGLPPVSGTNTPAPPATSSGSAFSIPSGSSSSGSGSVTKSGTQTITKTGSTGSATSAASSPTTSSGAGVVANAKSTWAVLAGALFAGAFAASL